MASRGGAAGDYAGDGTDTISYRDASSQALVNAIPAGRWDHPALLLISCQP